MEQLLEGHREHHHHTEYSEMKKVPGYLTNIIHNKDEPPDCLLLMEVPLMDDRQLQKDFADINLAPLINKIYAVDFASIACCIIQLLHLLTFLLATSPSPVKIQRMALLSEDIKRSTAASINQLETYESFGRSSFETEDERVPNKVLKILMHQGRSSSQNATLFNCDPKIAYSRLLQIIRTMVSMLPYQKVYAMTYHNIFGQFFQKWKQLTTNYTLRELEEVSSKQTRLFRDYSLYNCMKRMCFFNAVAKRDKRSPGSWKELDEKDFQALINFEITKIAYKSENRLVELRRNIERRNYPRLILYFKEHPVSEEHTLTFIEIQHNDVPVDVGSALDQYLSRIIQQQPIKITTGCSWGPQNALGEGNSARLSSFVELKSRMGAKLDERELLHTLSKLCMLDSILRVRLIPMLFSELNFEQHRAQTFHYFEQMNVSAVPVKPEHRYVKELQTYDRS